jgi:outer membrane protein
MFRSFTVGALAVCAVAVVFSQPASGQTAPGPIKAAVVDLRRAILDSAEIKKANADLQTKYNPRKDALDKAQRDLSDLQAQMQSSQGRLSPQGEAELQARGARKQREVERMTQDFQDDVNHERDAILQSAGLRMTALLKKMLEEKGLDMIVDTTQLLAFKPGLDVTNDAIAAFDKAYPLKAGK